jgi:four helix bundle protein
MERSHKKLRAWQQAVELVAEIYSATASFPKDEQFGLRGQLRRAAVSVPANLAEGCGRNGRKELLHFLGIAGGSLAELDTLVEIAERLRYLPRADELRVKIDEVSGLVMGLAASVKRRVSST